MKRLFLGAGIILAVVTIAFFSCQKEETIKHAEKSNLNDKLIVRDVYVNEGIPVYKNWDVVYSILENLKKNDETFRKSWENDLGFVSLRSKFDDYVDAETTFFNDLESEFKSKETELAEDDFLKRFKPVINEFKNSIIRVTLDDGSKFFDMNIKEYNYATVVNENGIMAVDGIIYRFTKNNERTIPISEWPAISELMKENSDVVNYITYTPNRLKDLNPPPGSDDDDDPPCDLATHSAHTANHWEHSMYDTYKGKYSKFKTIIYYNFTQKKYWYNTNNCVYHTYTKTDFNYTIRSLKTSAGIWRNLKADVIKIAISYEGDNIGTLTEDYNYYENTHTVSGYFLKNYITTSNHPNVTSVLITKLINYYFFCIFVLWHE
ncbi:MAG: hypothetical protein GXO79_04555 [Chlorobi bacterium]|nr:hypothetical protein [Chlorobiota bacterium]